MVRDIGNPTLTSINQQFEENLKPETYATHIIITHSEEEMLHHIIKILSDP